MNSVTVHGGGNVQIAVGSNGVAQVQNVGLPMYDSDLRRYAEFLFQEHATAIENSSVWEMAEEFLGFELEDAELTHVFELLNTAKVQVIVSW